MTKQVLFIQGGGAGTHRQLGQQARREPHARAWTGLRHPLPAHARTKATPVTRRGRRCWSEEIAALDDAAVLVGHSLGATILINALAEHAPRQKACRGLSDLSALCRSWRMAEWKTSRRSRTWLHVCRRQRLSTCIRAARMTLPPARTPIFTKRPFHRRTCASSKGVTTSSTTTRPRCGDGASDACAVSVQIWSIATSRK